ncbi:AMP-dependent synthetase/ligase [Sphingomonas bacterium]|uniref:AMP-dependent synthetase/ligase n=1 Tax=Sphingomonas bacterium TaxID=1895847 RepID=UPI001576636B|nr:long-chain fatty acid--CoA ligase [Sphingomonas bacterium]
MRTLEQVPNLVAMFFARAAERGERPFLWHRAGGSWQATGWTEAARQVASLAAGLRALGLAPGDRVMLVGENRPEWCISDLAIMAAGCVTVPTYVTNTERDHRHVIEDSGASAIIVSTAKLARTLLPAAIGTGRTIAIIGIDAMPAQADGPDVHDWRGLIAAHPAEPAECAAAASLGRGDPACIIYTSGTGGAPRGVVQHHGAILHNLAGAGAIVIEDISGNDENVFLSILPLSHAYEHTAGQFLPIGLGSQIYYADGLEKLAATIEEVRPTLMVVVPRLCEVLRTRIVKAIDKQGGLPARLLASALDLGAKVDEGRLSWRDWPKRLLVGAVLKPRIAKRFGGRLNGMVCGGAPLNPEVGRFFQSLGITLLQGYGQTETGPVIACNRPAAGIAMDTVGPPLMDTEVRIADDGEILVRGELVMHGYWRNEAETARVLRDGWLHTGDIGAFDAAGRLRITDRKKDLLVNDKGENVAPQKVEGMLTLQPEIAQAMIAGDRRPYMVALLVPDPEWEAAHAGTDPAARQAGLAAAVDRVNKELSVTERVRRFILADEPFTIANQQMTPSLKIRRHILREVYGERLDALYRS